jgi:hypothetical protein
MVNTELPPVAVVVVEAREHPRRAMARVVN